MAATLQPATPADAAEIAHLRNATADDLTAKFGTGPWSGHCTEKGVLFDLRQARVFVLRLRGQIVASLVLATKKPWAIDRSYFTSVPRPLYLLSMVVSPNRQRRGIGRRCVRDALRLARAWPAQSVILDAYDHPAGAGAFYRKCGFTEVGRVVYRKAPLIYFEALL